PAVGIEHDAKDGAAGTAVILPVGLLAFDFGFDGPWRQGARELGGSHFLGLVGRYTLGIDHLDDDFRHGLAPPHVFSPRSAGSVAIRQAPSHAQSVRTFAPGQPDRVSARVWRE